MADAAPNTPKKRRAQGPRVEKPVFAIVTASNEDGTPLQLNRDRLQITLERDAAKIVDLVTGGGAQGAAVVRVTMPVAPKRAAPVAA